VGAKHDKFKKSRAKGRLRGKKLQHTLIPTALTTMAKCNFRVRVYIQCTINPSQ